MRRWVDDGRLRLAAARVASGSSRAPTWRGSSPRPRRPVTSRRCSSRPATGFPGIVTQVEKDGLVAVVHIQAGPHRVTSLMTREAADELGIEPGDLAVAVVKSTNVVVEVPRPPRCEATGATGEAGIRFVARRDGDRGASGSRRRPPVPRRPQRRRRSPGTITVSAAASLTEAFTKMGDRLPEGEPGHDGHVQLRGRRRTLAQQIQGGAPADVFASADGANMQKLVTGGQVDGRARRVRVEPAHHRGEAGQPEEGQVAGRPRRPRRRVAVRATTVPCGKYAAPDPHRRRRDDPAEKITRGADVKATLAAVTTGDADAAIVYVTDAKAAGNDGRRGADPDVAERVAIYPIAPVAASQQPGPRRGAGSSTWCRRPASRRCRAFGFLPPPPSE